MNRTLKYTYSGANQDITKSKHDNRYYFDAEHVRIISTSDQSTGSITNEKGTELVITIPTVTINKAANTITYTGGSVVYTNGNEIDNDSTIPLVSSTQEIIGHATTRTGVVLFTTDDDGMDCIWEIENVVEGNYVLVLKYLRNLGFSIINPIQAIFNYENENIQKVYWVDGKNQIRHLNLRHESIDGNGLLIDYPSNAIDFVGQVDFSQPIITDVLSGGNHTAGMIQYAYNLYRLNSSQTKISPLSELIPLGKQQGGGEVNELVGALPVIEIRDIDTSYDYIKVYAIKYTSLNTIPSISLIEETEIPESRTLTLYDSGDIIDSLTLEEFLFLGSDPIIAKHINVKKNRLFPANITSKPFILPEGLDCRAFSYNVSSTSTIVWDSIYFQGGVIQGTQFNITSTSIMPPVSHDAVNIQPSTRRYKYNSTTYGGTGKYIEYTINVVTDSSLPDGVENYKFFKDDELYRIGIIFYNTLGQTSLPQWIGDYKMPKGNLSGNYNTLSVSLTNAFYTDFINVTYSDPLQKPVGYKILVAKRQEKDKSIIAQGIATPMIFQVTGDNATDWEQFLSPTIRENFSESSLKVPSYLTRNFTKIPQTAANDNNGVLLDTRHLAWLNDDPLNNNDEGGEIYVLKDNYFGNIRPSENVISHTFQYTKMFQIYTPEVTFDMSSNIAAASYVTVKGICQNTMNGVKAEERLVSSKEIIRNGKSESGLNPKRIPSFDYIEDNNFLKIFRTPESLGDVQNDYAFIGLPGNADSEGGASMAFYQYYRQFNNFTANTGNIGYPIYGSPEVTSRGADVKFYNNDPTLKYSNSLLSFTSDGEDDCDQCPLVSSINSYNSDCVTVVIGPNENSRRTLESIVAEASGLSTTAGVALIELRRDGNYIFTGSVYGGNTYEDKKRTEYLEVGEYNDINVNSVDILSPGDTFVQTFRFLRIHKTDTEVYDVSQLQISEIVEFRVETTVDLKNRNDISFSGWDGRFQPQEEEFHKYNQVYSQQPTLIVQQDTPLTFRRIDNFDTRIQSTKVKIPNESIDSWTDLLSNETMDINGKYGPINALVEFNDELYTFQDEAIAQLLINPNVQIQATDGVGIELGTGGILYNYKYLTTRSGAINKWGIVTGKRGIYYYDALNKGIGRVPDNMGVLLTDIKGFHSYFNNTYDYSYLKEDNPLILSGVVAGVDNYNNDIFFTLHQGSQSFTRCFNEFADEFIDLKKYHPTMYIYKGEKLLGVSSNTIHEHYAGEYNVYYGQPQSSKVTILVNPQSDIDTIINNIRYTSEVYLNSLDQPTQTLTHVRLYNEYQDSGRVPFTLGRTGNLRRRFREWRAAMPRQNGRRERIRNPWIFLDLEFENTSNYSLILHDISIDYTS